MLNYPELVKGDLIYQTDGKFVGEITGLINFNATVYLDTDDGRQVRIDPTQFEHYRKTA